MREPEFQSTATGFWIPGSPLRRAPNYDAWLMTDDAHGIGVIGGGRGSGFAHGSKGRCAGAWIED